VLIDGLSILPTQEAGFFRHPASHVDETMDGQHAVSIIKVKVRRGFGDRSHLPCPVEALVLSSPPRPGLEAATMRFSRAKGAATNALLSVTESAMGHALIFTYGAVAYAVFFVVFTYLIGFVGNMVVPKSIDSGAAVHLWQALVINTALVGLFAVQHSVMARPAFKSWWTRFVPTPVERSTYVLLASLILALLFWQWQPIPAVIWDVQSSWAATSLTAISLFGWLVALYSSFIIDHFDLFGLRQVYLHFRNRPYTHPPFAVRSLYRLVRHPLMVGILIFIWSAPTMTAGHLLFSFLLTGYIFVGVTMEERDLARYIGNEYHLYRSQTPMLVPSLPKRKTHETPGLGGGALPEP
jgi:methanethiol S-methyltransferase